MIAYIVMVLSLLLDGVLTNFFPYMVGDLDIFYPMLTLMSVILIYPFYKKNEKKYFLTIFILGIIYDLLYTNLLIFDGVMFLLVGYIVKTIYKNIPTNFLTILLYAIIGIIIYDSVSSLIFIIFRLVPISFGDIIYKISHSIVLNLIYIEIIYLILKLIPKKYTKVNIN